LSLGFLTDRGDLSPFSLVAAAMTGRIDTWDVCELACGVAVVQKRDSSLNLRALVGGIGRLSVSSVPSGGFVAASEAVSHLAVCWWN
jgi:hypothetical protein